MINYQIEIIYINGHTEMVEFTTDDISKTMEQFARNRESFHWDILKATPSDSKIIQHNDNRIRVNDKTDITDVKLERILLSKMYDCQELMEELLNLGKQDPHYEMITMLIKRLEDHLKNNQDLL